MLGPKKTTLLIIIITLLLGGFGLGYVDDSANHKAPKTFLSKE